MRLSTSPVGPLMVIAFACSVFSPALADDFAGRTVAPGELRGAVDNASSVAQDAYAITDYSAYRNSAWGFLVASDSAIYAEALPPAVPAADDNAVEKPLTEEERARIFEALMLAPRDLGATASKTVRKSNVTIARPSDLEVTRNQGSNGLSTVVFNKPIAPSTGNWNAKVGADLGMADTTTVVVRPNPLRMQRDERGANAAWASVGVNEFATVDARVNPGSDQGLVATTFQRSMPIGSHLSMTLQSRTSMTETFGRGGVSQFDIPMAALPAADGSTAQRVWAQDNTARFKILATGTSFGAGVSANSVDTVTHNTLTAEQQLFGPVSVSTAINDVGQTSESRSLSARAKFKW